MNNGNNCPGPKSYKPLTKKGIVKKHVDHLRKKESSIQDKIYPEMQLQKWELNQTEITVNSLARTNNPSQHIRDPNTQKQLRTQIYILFHNRLMMIYYNPNLGKLTPGVAVAVIQILFSDDLNKK